VAPENIVLPLVYKIRRAASPGAGPNPALVLLHGRGSDEDALPELAARVDPRFLVVGVRAPRPCGRPGGGYTWYDIPGAFTPHPRHLEEGSDRLRECILGLARQYPVDRRRVYAAGFSMGGVLCYALALAAPRLLGGVAVHSGYIPGGLRPGFVRDRLQGLPVFVAHGTGDPVVPVGLARSARAILAGAGAEITYREYPAPHRITRASLDALTAWLREALA